MNNIISDFFKLGSMRIISKVLTVARGLIIVASLTPTTFGEYTIWLLFVFYFFMLDFGVLNGLERDIPHYRGLNDHEAVKRVQKIGWSAYFVLSFMAATLLAIVSFVVFNEWLLSILLGLYLFSDKFYRAYYSSSRIHVKYRESGIAELIIAGSSLALVFLLLPRIGIYGIFIAFIISALISSYFLSRKCPLEMKWQFDIKEYFVYVKSAIPLAAIVYSIEIFHAIAMTILAIKWDKATLGYFAFAYKIFHICLQIFPFLIQEVMRTRMYYQVAQLKEENGGIQKLFYPMGVYCLVTAFFWLGVYWWADWGIQRFLPQYTGAIITLKLLTLALLPLGIAKICSDYLCSHVERKSGYAVKSWAASILLQAVLLLSFNLTTDSILYYVPVFYLFSTLLIYGLVVGAAFNIHSFLRRGSIQVLFMFLPLGVILMVLYILKNYFHVIPSAVFGENVLPFVFSFVASSCIVAVLIIMGRYSRSVTALMQGK